MNYIFLRCYSKDASTVGNFKHPQTKLFIKLAPLFYNIANESLQHRTMRIIYVPIIKQSSTNNISPQKTIIYQRKRNLYSKVLYEKKKRKIKPSNAKLKKEKKPFLTSRPWHYKDRSINPRNISWRSLKKQFDQSAQNHPIKQATPYPSAIRLKLSPTREKGKYVPPVKAIREPGTDFV